MDLDKLSFFWDPLLCTSICSIIINTCMYNDCAVYNYIGKNKCILFN